MLTVKVIHSGGNEFIKEVSSVWVDVKWENGKPVSKNVYFYEAKGMLLGDRIEEGDIFVMNENGKTIADYHLHPPIETTNSIHSGSNGRPVIETKQ